MGKYQGWSNRSTWNANLWLSNDHGTYSFVEELADEHGDDFKSMGHAVFGFAVELWGKETPDGDSLADVNWLEIATDWRA